ncbi:formate dehydrogenase accessory sulfurtransferase FdhD [Roseibium litorale]|uniref:Sulfur carrier protein FdhD n=1 Tax=Roseibium litorale TaxID=2803841 RepID=A0ABR9CLL0_9HYPH|nr:formate dehydrogenase accessory sulfurtransferase FdhD [Roseibium litorale]MBD8891207.1 formate dehydrogenase accessory sulfurtransferase FdhD [Roseibium litorale]
MDRSRRSEGHAYRAGSFQRLSRELACETAVAISYNGSAHAVLMATPSDLEDLALGFTLSEGIARKDQIERIEVVETPLGADVQVWLTDEAADTLAKRRRAMAGPVGCGMCGLESIEAAMRHVPEVFSTIRLQPAQIIEAVARMERGQELNRLTRAVHAAGFYDPVTCTVTVREDAGRHNAMDKLIGARARTMDGVPAQIFAGGAVVMSSRLSIELVQKAAVAGCGILIAVSAPTSLAVSTAENAGMTLVALARGSDFDIYTRPDRIIDGVMPDVA